MSDIARRLLVRKEDLAMSALVGSKLAIRYLALQNVGELFNEGFKSNR